MLAFGTRRSRTIAGLRRAFEQATGTDGVASPFHYHFTPAVANLLRALRKELIDGACLEYFAMHGPLMPFEAKVVADSMVIGLHDRLKRSFKVCRTNHTLAALKAHVVMNVLGAGPCSVKFTSERVHDGPTPTASVGHREVRRLIHRERTRPRPSDLGRGATAIDG